ncbi:MAG TPA: hypothetical protein VMH22_00385 [bacterium]|nr:hypothetical protein [bacterium]
MAKRGRGRAWVFLICWIALTCFLMTYPFRGGPSIIGRGYDKVIHTSLFTVMGLSAQAAIPWASLLIAAPLAVGLELIQKKIPARHYDIVDMMANATGMLLGIFAYELSTRLSR